MGQALASPDTAVLAIMALACLIAMQLVVTSAVAATAGSMCLPQTLVMSIFTLATYVSLYVALIYPVWWLGKYTRILNSFTDSPILALRNHSRHVNGRLVLGRHVGLSGLLLFPSSETIVLGKYHHSNHLHDHCWALCSIPGDSNDCPEHQRLCHFCP